MNCLVDILLINNSTHHSLIHNWLQNSCPWFVWYVTIKSFFFKIKYTVILYTRERQYLSKYICSKYALMCLWKLDLCSVYTWLPCLLESRTIKMSAAYIFPCQLCVSPQIGGFKRGVVFFSLLDFSVHWDWCCGLTGLPRGAHRARCLSSAQHHNTDKRPTWAERGD